MSYDQNLAGKAKQRLLRNGLFNSSTWVINSVMQLLMIPFLVSRLDFQPAHCLSCFRF